MLSFPGDCRLSLERELSRLLPAWPEARLCVALSGGVDSIVLLDACAALRADRPGLALRAVHVHHGLQADADGWQSRCVDLCARLGLPLEVVWLALEPRRGESVEALAREARYRALEERLAPGEALLTAHHEDDQLETVLLQLARGAGVAGLAAMPAVAPFGAGLHLRPLLGVARDTLVAHARAAGLDWVEDPMNASLRFDRGWLRERVTPLLRERWPAVSRSVSRSVRHLAEAQGLLDELAALDAVVAREGDCLNVPALRALSRPRQGNLVRWWLRHRGLGAPSTARLASILDEVIEARPDGSPVVTWAGGEVRRYRDLLYAMAPLAPPPPAGWSQPLAAGQPVALPAGLGRVSLEPAIGEGLWIPAGGDVPTVRFRHGGERLQPLGQGSSRTLKKLFQEAAILPWMRDRIPLLTLGDRVVAVADLWTAAEAAAGPRVSAWRVTWRDRPAYR